MRFSAATVLALASVGAATEQHHPDHHTDLTITVPTRTGAAASTPCSTGEHLTAHSHTPHHTQHPHPSSEVQPKHHSTSTYTPAPRPTTRPR
ncbi:hypothetical protein BM221_002517 [Beauveria bassiana]|uniref:Uncharacterized protein n=1 Tax=Beauveria bassiana TaxID=176275 RepID=A0A2N6NYS3_BEABA|nr:hypothetical protein BM221_002517 [Beauveria bassiana]